MQGLWVRATGIVTLMLWLGSGAANAQAPEAASKDVFVWNPETRQLYHGKIPHHMDPLENFNRGTAHINDWLALHAIAPVGKVYRVATPRLMRSSIKNFGDNLRTPVSVFNNLLQLNSLGTINELGRFVINSTLGIGGLFRADKWIGMEENREDFGQTMAVWGLPAGPYLVLPVAGPSTVTDTIGDLVDLPLSGDFWVGLPLWSRVLILFNNNLMSIQDYELSTGDTLEEFKYDLMRSAYYASRQAAIAKRKPLYGAKPDVQKLANPFHQSITYALSAPQSDDFIDESNVVPIMLDPSRRSSTAYRIWRNGAADSLVVLVPGTGGSIYDKSSMRLAESFFDSGNSVILLDSPFNWKSLASYIGAGDGSAMPGMMREDVQDFAHLLEKVLYDASHHQMHKKAAKGKARGDEPPFVFAHKSVVGVSLGGLVTLHLSALPSTAAPQFDRYLALNPPIDIVESVQRVDQFYDSFFELQKGEATARLQEFAVKIGALQNERTLESLTRLSDEEARFAIGYSFHLTVASVIYQSQQINDLGVLKTPKEAGTVARLDEIFNFGFQDYIEKFVIPAKRKLNPNGPHVRPYTLEDYRRENGFAAVAESVGKDARVFVLHSKNDPTVSAESLAKLEQSMPKERLILMDSGGHLGAFTQAEALGLLNHLVDQPE